MKSSFSAALLKVLQQSPQTIQFRPDLFIITLRNGQTIYATSGQLDLTYTGSVTIFSSPVRTVLTFSGQKFYATKYGSWNRGAVISAASGGCSTESGEGATQLESNPMSLQCIAGSYVLFPGTNTSLMQTLNIGLFDKADVIVLTAYMPSYGDFSLGLEVKFRGQITNVDKAGRSMARFKVNDGIYLLKLPWPPNQFQSPCRHVLYNPNCTLNQASFTDSYTAASGSTPLTINTTSSLLHPSDTTYYTQGIITFTGGQNNGLTGTVKAQGASSVTLMVPMLFPVATGDTFTLSAGCDKTASTCLNRFNNEINFGGQPFVPAPEFAI